MGVGGWCVHGALDAVSDLRPAGNPPDAQFVVVLSSSANCKTASSPSFHVCESLLSCCNFSAVTGMTVDDDRSDDEDEDEEEENSKED